MNTDPTVIDPSLIKPVGDHLLIRTFVANDTTASGLTIVDNNSNSFPVSAEVIAAGPQSKYKVGDKVLYRRYALDELKVSSGGVTQTIAMLEDSDVLATYGDVDVPSRPPYDQIKKLKGEEDITNNEDTHADEETANGGGEEANANASSEEEDDADEEEG